MKAEQCSATRGGVVDRRNPVHVTVGGYRCSKPKGHKGNHHDRVKGHRWA